MPKVSTNRLAALPVCLALCLMCHGCARPEPATGNASEATTEVKITQGGRALSITPTARLDDKPEPTQAVRLAPATPAEVAEAVRRVYGRFLTVRDSQPSAFVTGEFNGDTSEDLAVLVKMAPEDDAYLAINDEYANWTIDDPIKSVLPNPESGLNALPTVNERPLVRRNDDLIAVIHGLGPQGWRNPEARQSYLLKGVAGQALKAEPAQALVNSAKDVRTLLLKGHDVIAETVMGQPGILFWAGGAYVWIPESQGKRGAALIAVQPRPGRPARFSTAQNQLYP
ncbi:MAG TPA: hypothetical protein VJX67_02435 [Blastocatellia bacterium]|nr:hypothetical protein [Blastocatellia bacterium]